MLDGKVIHGFVIVDTGVAFPAIETPSKGRAELPDEIVVRDAKVAELEGEPNEVGKKVGCVNAAIHKDSTEDIGVRECAKG